MLVDDRRVTAVHVHRNRPFIILVNNARTIRVAAAVEGSQLAALVYGLINGCRRQV